jgi:hypothetical protein
LIILGLNITTFEHSKMAATIVFSKIGFLDNKHSGEQEDEDEKSHFEVVRASDGINYRLCLGVNIDGVIVNSFSGFIEDCDSSATWHYKRFYAVVGKKVYTVLPYTKTYAVVDESCDNYFEFVIQAVCSTSYTDEEFYENLRAIALESKSAKVRECFCQYFLTNFKTPLEFS